METRHLPKVMIAVGCLVILAAGIIKWDAGRRQSRLVNQYEGYVAELVRQAEPPSETVAPPSTPLAPLAPLPPEAPAASAALESPPAPEAPANLIGILTIPKINLTVAIGEGTDEKTLLHAVGHFPETAGPGEVGNFAITGHRGHLYGPFFLQLDQVGVDDTIIVQRGTQTLTYRVTDTLVVEPQDSWVLNPTEEAQITLITCTPTWINTHRLVVKGVLAATQER